MDCIFTTIYRYIANKIHSVDGKSHLLLLVFGGLVGEEMTRLLLPRDVVVRGFRNDLIEKKRANGFEQAENFLLTTFLASSMGAYIYLSFRGFYNIHMPHDSCHKNGTAVDLVSVVMTIIDLIPSFSTGFFF